MTINCSHLLNIKKKLAVLTVLIMHVVLCAGSAQAAIEFKIPEELIDQYRTEKTLPADIAAEYYIQDGVLFFNDVLVAYPESKTDREYAVPGGIRYIGECAFMYNRFLERVTMPESVIKIGSSAFGGCTALADVQLSANLQVIDSGAFWNCYALENITLPMELYAIGELAFAEMGLKEITIPASVRYVGDEAFALSPVLKVHFEGCVDYVGICVITPYGQGGPNIEVFVPSFEYAYVEQLQERYGDNNIVFYEVAEK